MGGFLTVSFGGVNWHGKEHRQPWSHNLFKPTLPQQQQHRHAEWRLQLSSRDMTRKGIKG